MCLRGFFAVTISCVMVSVTAAQNIGERLLDGTATFDYTSGGNNNLPSGPPNGSGTIPMNFQLDGIAPDLTEQQLVKGNWYYRISGDSRERYLGDPGAVKTTAGGNFVEWDFQGVYDNGATAVPNVIAHMGFELTSYNPDSAAVDTWLCFTNNGSTTIFVEKYFIADFHLDATAAGDDYDPLMLSPGGVREIRATDGSTIGVLYGRDTTGSAMGVASSLFSQLNDGSVDTFPDVNNGGGLFADGAALLQLEEIVRPGTTSSCIPIRIAVARNGEEPVIPEPTGIALVIGCLFVASSLRIRG